MKKNFINGSWHRASGEIFASLNPVSAQALWLGHESTWADVDEAVMSARAAFKSWSLTSFKERLGFFEKYRGLLEKSKSELALLISQESGKPRWESLLEVGAMIGKLAISVNAYEERCPHRSLAAGDAQSSLRFRAIGVMGVLGPFNLPVHLPNGHIIPALLAGNTIVFKPSEQTPASGSMMIDLLQQSGLPLGVVNLIQGGKVTGEALVAHKDVNGILFTGSFKVGRALHRKLGGYPHKMLALEMGGNNPLVVDEVKDIQAAVYTTIQSAFITAGQRCVCARRLIVPQGDEGDKFIAALCHATEEIVYGDPAQEPQPFLGTLISVRAAEKVIGEYGRLLALGAEELVELKQHDEIPASLSPGIIDVTGLDVKDEEIFGPLLQVIRVADFSAAVEESNNTAFGLSAGLLSDSKEKYQLFLQASRAGIINWNRQITGAVSTNPFGGSGQSGNFRPSAYFAADYCAYPVASIEKEELALPEKLTPGVNL